MIESGALIDGIPSEETEGEATLTNGWKEDLTAETQEVTGFFTGIREIGPAETARTSSSAPEGETRVGSSPSRERGDGATATKSETGWRKSK